MRWDLKYTSRGRWHPKKEVEWGGGEGVGMKVIVFTSKKVGIQVKTNLYVDQNKSNTGEVNRSEETITKPNK